MKTTQYHLISLDPGNGMAQAATNARPELIEFEPVIAPMTDKRGLEDDKSRPRFTLREENQVLVFGLDDVQRFGRTVAARRLNAMERYGSGDYLRLCQVLMLQALAAHRGSGEYVAPVVALCLPISQYNNADTVDSLKQDLAGKRRLCDQDGCELLLDLQPKRLAVVPESYGALMRWAYNPKTLKAANETAGSTLVIDIGYETTDVSLFIGQEYQRDAGFSILKAGMGVIARQVQDYARRVVRNADISMIDRAMRKLAGVPVGAKKQIEIVPGVAVDITELYDVELQNLVDKIQQETLTRFSDSVARVLLSGGGAYHAAKLLATDSSWNVVQAQDPGRDNVLGALIALQLKTAGR